MTPTTRKILALATRSEARVEAVRAALAARLIDGLLLRLKAGEGFTIQMPGRRKRDTIHVRVEVEDTAVNFFGLSKHAPLGRRSRGSNEGQVK